MLDFQYVFIDPLIDSEDFILEIRARALKLYAEGKTIMQYSSEGTEATREFSAPVQSILAETRMALKSRWPWKYGKIITQSRVIRLG